jgi:hypothetical protein
VSLVSRDVTDVEALVTDRYLDALLAARDDSGAVRGSGVRAAAPRRALAGRLDDAVRLASERLVRDLPRFHPSFRFEERLAVRLAEAAAAMRLPAAAGAEGSMAAIPFPAPELPAGFDPFAEVPDEAPPFGSVPRPLLIGGAVAASALSLAGAAVVAWRRSHPGGSPMARAARAAHAMRERPV